MTAATLVSLLVAAIKAFPVMMPALVSFPVVVAVVVASGVGIIREPAFGQRAVTAAVGGHDLLRDDHAVLHVVELELLRVAEMLKDLSVFVRHCDSHIVCSFLHDVFRSLIVKPDIPAADQEPFAVYQGLRR